ncbi:MAG TPA: RagB/SusD family nutrient uptake outer membrane protein [Niabella sp.]|nr:RagB/SusD family nutrient uptake outer membrane protein [Niabella sp.]
MQLKHLLFIALTSFLFGCKKILDVQPRDQFTSANLFATKEGFYSAATGIYDELASTSLYGRAMTYEMIDIMAKRYAVNPGNAVYVSYNQQNYFIGGGSMDQVWSKAYFLILSGNILMDHIRRQEGILTTDESNILRGEMLAARAFLHFDLLRLYGPRWENNASTVSIPYNEKPTAERLPLLSFETIIGKVIRDLDEAEVLLAKDPVINQGPLASAPDPFQSVQLRYRQFRLNYFSTIALKARVYLYAGKKTEALTTAKRLLADQNLHQHFPAVNPTALLNNQVDPDRVFSSEVLMGIYLKTRDTVFNNTFNFATAPALNYLKPYPQFLERLFAFGGSTGAKEYEDYRYKSQWEPSPAGGHMFTKYKPITQPGVDIELFYSRMIPLIRLSEVYYIAAESEPNPADGFAWLNQMRPRRGLAPIDPAQYNTLAAQFPTLLANEYLREFYGEGQAFFFFKRTAFRQHYENGSAFAVSNYSDAAYRLPLPQAEIIYHP